MSELHTRTAQYRASTWREEDRSVEGVIATEQPVRVFDPETWEEVDEVLLMRGLRQPPRALPLLDTHRRGGTEYVRGSTREIRVEGDRVIARMYFAGDQASVDAAEKVRDGHVTDFSIGYSVHATTRIPAGESSTVEGTEYEARGVALHVVTDWELRENSVCPLGADDQAKARGAAPEESRMDEEKKENASPPEETRDEGAITIDLAAERERIRAEIEEQARAEAVRAERERIAEIRRLGEGVAPEIVERAVMEGFTVEQAKDAFLTALRTARASSLPAIHTPEPVRGARAVIDAIALDYRIWRPRGDEEERRAEQAESLRGHHPMEYVRMILEDRGAYRRGMDAYEMIRLAFALDRERADVAPAPSTVLAPSVFSNIVNLAAMTGFVEAPDTTRRWTSTRTVGDYKQITSARLSSYDDLEEVPEGGSITDVSVTDQGESYVLKRYAKGLTLDEITLINDSLGEFLATARKLAAAAGRLRPDLVYAILTDNPTLGADGITLFHATSHGGNLDSNAFSQSALGTGITTMATQKGPKSEDLNILPRFLIGPHALRASMLAAVNSTLVVVAGSTDLVRGNMNAYADYGIEVVTDARLDTDSSTAWYLAADPNVAPTIEVAELRGMSTPRVTEVPVQTSIRRRWEVVFACAAKALDYRGLYQGNA